MIAKTQAPSLIGLEGKIVNIEVCISNGLPGFDIVGLPDTAVKEARDRVKAAIKNSGWEFPMLRVLVNLAPADIKKEGAYFDLPIALSLLCASGQIKSSLDGWALMGELALDGEVRPVHGILPATLVVKENGIEKIIVPRQNGPEAYLVKGVQVYPVKSLREAVEMVNGNVNRVDDNLSNDNTIVYKNIDWPKKKLDSIGFDMREVQGQAGAKRALEVAAAGGHNVLMVGPPGSGKTMLARRIITIMPELYYEEALETTKIYSIAGQVDRNNPLMRDRPFRAPHHTVSAASLIGGGRLPRPGEVSLAHMGVLYLDEFPEFKRDALEALRQPLEDGTVTVARVHGTATFPAQMMLVASMNPCPCGYWGDGERECHCTPHQVQTYLNRISGPLLDRIDIHLQLRRLKYSDLTGNT